MFADEVATVLRRQLVETQNTLSWDEQKRFEQRKRERNVLKAFWTGLGIGVLSLVVFSFGALGSLGTKTFALALLVGGAATLTGSLLGFLFGLPRGAGDRQDFSLRMNQPSNPAGNDPKDNPSSVSSANRSLAQVNNNLLEISDWLTKIIVGAGLVGLKELVQWIGNVGQVIGTGAGLEPVALARVFGGSTIMFFFVWGFLFVYIQTRTIISFIFASMEHSLQQLTLGEMRMAIATEVRETVLPQIESLSENAILQMLYTSGPGATNSVIERAQKFLSSPGNESNARVWLYLACAHGQQHAVANDTNKPSLADAAYDALQKALAIEPSLRTVARGLLYTDEPTHLPGDDDLQSFRDDKRFHELVGPPPSPKPV
jgi:hypothetical protein